MQFDQINPKNPQQFIDAIADGSPIEVCRIRDHSAEWIDDFVEFCEQTNYRIAWIEATSDCFGGARLQFYTWLVAYKGANFNIQPPILREYKQSVYDAIGELRYRETCMDDNDGFDCWPVVSSDEMKVIEQTANGWSTNNTIQYSAVPLPKLERNFRRLSWPVGTFYLDEIPIYPDENRPLTNGELKFLNYDTSAEWIEQQIELYYLDHWAQQDWQSRYSIAHKQWLGHNTAGQFDKEFNLIGYAPLWCKPYDAAMLKGYWPAKFVSKKDVVYTTLKKTKMADGNDKYLEQILNHE